MEDYLDFDYKAIFNQIKQLDVALQYAACSKFLDLIRPYFCRCTIERGEKFFYRVRAHAKHAGEYFYGNISDLSFRTDFFGITKFGRCNCPFESVFYCSDNPFLAFAEVSRLNWLETQTDVVYYTTTVWKRVSSITLVPIFEYDVDFANNDLLNMTHGCLKIIDEMEGYTRKKELKEFHSVMGKEFMKPFSLDNSAYQFSSAVTNYLLSSKYSERIDAVVYSTCLNEGPIKNIGLNYAFNPLSVGHEKCLELVAVYRSKVKRHKNQIFEAKRYYGKKINRYTGEIKW